MTQAADTLVVDQRVVDAFTSQAAYDYNREVVQNETSYLEYFLDWLRDLFSTSGETVTTDDRFEFLWWIAVVAVVLLLIWWLSGVKWRLFARSGGDDELEYDVDLAGIHDIDYDARLAEARARGDHAEVCRLLYLLTLKRLADGGRVEWRPFKTPSQYAREVGDQQLREMTNAFLRVRYGKFEATEALVQQMQVWHEHVLTLIDVDQEQKGGEAS